MYYVYILRCADGSFYTGSTSNVVKRVREHYYRLPGGARYTKSHPVTGLEAVWICDSKSSALKIECKIKKLRKGEKVLAIAGVFSLYDFFPDLSEIPIVRTYNYNFSDIVSEEN